MPGFVKDFIWSLSFLTVIPVDPKGRIAPSRMGVIMFWFPVVGLLIGLILVGVNRLATLALPLALTDALIVAFYVALTGALHADGFADTLDGVFGGNSPERRLEIMRDSRIGSYGAIGIGCLLGVKYAGVHVIPAGAWLTPDALNKPAALLLMPALGRWAQTLATGCCQYARGGPGTGSLFVNATKPWHALIAAVLPFGLTIGLFGHSGCVLLAITAAAALVWMFWVKSRIGGMTGDTIGSVGEVAEVAFLVAFAGLSARG